MNRLLFYLDGTEYPSPVDWKDVESEVKRDFKARTISVQYSTTATFSGSAYAYLSGRYDALGICGEVKAVVTETCGGETVRVIAGRIIMSDCKWDLDKCQVECSIVDDGLGARIHNNAKIEVSPLAAISKTGTPITACPVLALTLADTSDADLTGTRRAFDWFDAVTHALAYMTDGEVSVQSSWYSALPSSERYCFCIGVDLRISGSATTRLSYSFDDLFVELAIKYDLWMHPTMDSAGNAILRIEPGTFFFGDAQGVVLPDVPGVVRSVDTDRMYATVKVGSSEYIREMVTSNPLPYISLLGFTEETFTFDGQCNTDAELDLVSDWIIDPNVILKCTVGGVDDWDDGFFLLQYTTGGVRVTMSQYLNPGGTPWLHNEALLNANVLSRHPLRSRVGFQASSATANNFRAEYTTPQVGAIIGLPYAGAINEIVGARQQSFDDDFTAPNFDTSNTWGNGTTPGTPVPLSDCRFTPTVQGMYSFMATLSWRITYMRADNFGNLFASARGGMRARIYNSLDVLVYEVHRFSPWVSATPYAIVNNNFNWSIVVDHSQYVVFEFFVQRGPPAAYGVQSEVGVWSGALPAATNGVEVEIMTGAVLQCLSSITALQVSPTIPSHLTVYEFTKSVTAQEWKTLTDIPENIVTFGQTNGHVMEAKRKIYGGETDFKVIL